MRMQATNAPIGAPADPTLRQVIAAWSRAGYFAIAVDEAWRLVSLSTEVAELVRDERVLGAFLYGPEQIDTQLRGRAGVNVAEELRLTFREVGPWLLGDLGRSVLREMVHPIFRDIVEDLEPRDGAALALDRPTTSYGSSIGSTAVYERVRDSTGRVVGTVIVSKPAVGMNTLFLLTAPGDLGHFERMRRLAAAGRRPAAILFADLEGSAPLAKRLPTAGYFHLVRALTRAADECVVDTGGLVGRHAGDGVTAFFVAETAGSESAAARACIEALQALRAALHDLATRYDLSSDELAFRAGLHWGTTLYIGSIITRGRTEVTALGDEVNEAARIEACATGGRALASKSLIERLNRADADALGIHTGRTTYTSLADLATATDKARRDAPSIAVCEV
jgi:class 3 adenylate cyclase